MCPQYTPRDVATYLLHVEQRLMARFWKYVDRTDSCWQWTGPTDEFGYGRFGMTAHGIRRSPRAHRMMYEMYYGPIPDGSVVMHLCDNPPCCRPDHLQLGSIAENNLDRDTKGRGRIALKGETNPSAKLTDAQVRSIRANWTGADGQIAALCREYGVKAPAMYAVVRGTGWKHLL